MKLIYRFRVHWFWVINTTHFTPTLPIYPSRPYQVKIKKKICPWFLNFWWSEMWVVPYIKTKCLLPGWKAYSNSWVPDIELIKQWKLWKVSVLWDRHVHCRSFSFHIRGSTVCEQSALPISPQSSHLTPADPTYATGENNIMKLEPVDFSGNIHIRA